MFRYLILPLVLTIITADAQVPPAKWSRLCGEKNVRCLTTSIKLNVSGASQSQIAERLDKFLKLTSNSEGDCMFTNANIDSEDYTMCWSQAEWQKRGTNIGKHYCMTAERKSADDSGDYEFYL